MWLLFTSFAIQREDRWQFTGRAVKGQDEHLKADDAAEAAEHLVDGDVMVGVGGQARVVHARDALMLL